MDYPIIKKNVLYAIQYQIKSEVIFASHFIGSKSKRKNSYVDFVVAKINMNQPSKLITPEIQIKLVHQQRMV